MLETELGRKTWSEPKFSQRVRYKLFRVASKIAKRGEPAKDGTVAYEYSGTYEASGQNLDVSLTYLALAGEERIEVSIGEEYSGVVKRADQPNTSVSDEHQVVGNLPGNTLEILSSLAPQN